MRNKLIGTLELRAQATSREKKEVPILRRRYPGRSDQVPLLRRNAQQEAGLPYTIIDFPRVTFRLQRVSWVRGLLLFQGSL